MTDQTGDRLPIGRGVLIWPPVLVLVFLAMAYHWSPLNVHGSGLFVLFGLAITGVVALLTAIFGVAAVLPQLLRNPNLRTPANVAATVFSAAYVAILVGRIVWEAV